MADILYAQNSEKHRHENYPTPEVPDYLKGISWQEHYQHIYPERKKTMPFLQNLLPFLLPLFAQYADQTIPLGLKRWLFLNMVALGSEAQAWLKKTQTTLDDQAFDAMLAEAYEEFEEAGLHTVASQLDAFVPLSL